MTTVASGVVVQPDGKIVVVGLASGGLGLLRLLPNGDFDSTFTEGVVTQGLFDYSTKDDPGGYRCPRPSRGAPGLAERPRPRAEYHRGRGEHRL